MKLVNEYTSDTTMLAAALLHDVIEDTDVTAEQLLDFLQPVMGEKQAKRTAQLVKELTDVYIKDKYPQWNRRKRKSKETERLASVSAEAQTIKYADITDNSLSIMNAEDDFMTVYLKEARQLLNAMTKGNTSLRQRAIETVDSCLEDARKKIETRKSENENTGS
jgi:guanosine-3',5'-bis(diphosphate) 3'-pyrophosphohydrolase